MLQFWRSKDDQTKRIDMTVVRNNVLFSMQDALLGIHVSVWIMPSSGGFGPLSDCLAKLTSCTLGTGTNIAC